MIEKAAALAENKGWDFEILSPRQLAVAIASPRWQFFHAVDIYCSIDGGAWGFVMLKEFEILSEREQEVNLAVCRLQQFCEPGEFDLVQQPDCFIRYARDIDIAEEVETHLGSGINKALAKIDTAWTVLQLVNWGGKSVDEAIAHVGSSELQELRTEQSSGSGKVE